MKTSMWQEHSETILMSFLSSVPFDPSAEQNANYLNP